MREGIKRRRTDIKIRGGSLFPRKSTSRLKRHVHPVVSTSPLQCRSSNEASKCKKTADDQYYPLCVLSGFVTLLCWVDGLPDCTPYLGRVEGLSGFIPKSDVCAVGHVFIGMSPLGSPSPPASSFHLHTPQSLHPFAPHTRIRWLSSFPASCSTICSAKLSCFLPHSTARYRSQSR
jgi:hypothetical protein